MLMESNQNMSPIDLDALPGDIFAPRKLVNVALDGSHCENLLHEEDIGLSNFISISNVFDKKLLRLSCVKTFSCCRFHYIP